jgi:DNA-binding XRE family transcriptional regulator
MLKLIIEHFSGVNLNSSSDGAGIFRLDEIEALTRLMSVAEGADIEAARCAVFLLGWYAPGEIGGVDLSLVGWGLSSGVTEDMVKVFGFMLRIQQRRLSIHSPKIDRLFHRLMEQWFPEVLGLDPTPPRGIDLRSFRNRHDLTARNVAKLLRVPVATVESWERDQYPMPLPLWIELRTLMGERRSILTVPGVAVEPECAHSAA